MPGKTKWLSTLLAITLAIVGLGVSATADSGSEQDFLSAINATRSSAGLGPLKMDSGLQAHARRHSADMIAADKIYHSSDGELKSAAGGGWTKLGENVGRGGSVSSLHKAFLDSASHRANIHGDYNRVGIGTETAPNGVLYVTVVFMKKGATETTTTTAPKASEPSKGDPIDDGPATDKPAESKPAQDKTTTPESTTTTVPPTTTTTLIVGPDKPVTPGESCFEATRYWWLCHD